MIKQSKNKKIFATIILICILLYALQVILTTCFSHTNANETIPILGFHNVVYDEEKETYFKNNMWVDSESAFVEKMQYLYDEGYHTLTLDELYAWKQGTLQIDDKAFVLTFDDGYLASSELIAPILGRYNFTATTFVVGKTIASQPQTWDGSELQFMSQVDMSDQSIMHYASHTFAMHDKIDGEFAIHAFTKTEMQEDFAQEQNVVDCSYVAYPFGKYSDTMVEVLEENQVKLAFGYNENQKASIQDHPYRLPRFAITAYTTMDSFQAMLESR